MKEIMKHLRQEHSDTNNGLIFMLKFLMLSYNKM